MTVLIIVVANIIVIYTMVTRDLSRKPPNPVDDLEEVYSQSPTNDSELYYTMIATQPKRIVAPLKLLVAMLAAF